MQTDKIKCICKKRGFVFIEDSVRSIGTQYKGRKVGSLADIKCFSFHSVKTTTRREVFTDDEELYRKLILARGHGITHDKGQMEGVPA